MLERAHDALLNPVWPLALGRKSYVPSEPIWIPDGVVDAPLLDALSSWPWLGTLWRGEKAPPDRLVVSLDSPDGDGVLRMDQPLSSFAERKFGARHVRSESVELKPGADHAVA